MVDVRMSQMQHTFLTFRPGPIITAHRHFPRQGSHFLPVYVHNGETANSGLNSERDFGLKRVSGHT